MTRNEHSFQWAMAGVFAVICFTFFHWFYPNHLFLKEQMRIFLYTTDYFMSFWDEPAWFSCYVGNFLTQFYYLKGMGPLIITLTLLLLWYVSMRVLRKFGGGNMISVYAMLPVALEWGLLCRLTYNISSTLSLIFVLFLFLAYIKIRDKRLSIWVAFILMPIIYSMVGSRLFIFSLMIIFYEGAKNRKRWWFWLLLLVSSYLYPYFMRHFYGLTIEEAYKYSYVDGLSVYFPAVLLILEVFALHIKWVRKARLNRQTVFSTLFILFVLFGAVILNTNTKRERVLALDSVVYAEDWDKVLSLSEKFKSPGLMVHYFRNIAWAKKGQLPDRLMENAQFGSDALFLPIEVRSSMLPVFFSNEVYYQIGDMEMARHRTIQGVLFSPKQRSGRMIKRLVEIDLQRGDTVEAMRYLNLLASTLFYREWAEQRMASLASYSYSDDRYLPRKKDWEQTPDIMQPVTDYPVMLDSLVKSQPDNKKALDYLLCFYLLDKKLNAFKTAFDAYYKGRYTPVPRLYDEALLQQRFLRDGSIESSLDYPIAKEVIDGFNEYRRAKGEKTKEELQNSYSSCYWFYFDSVRKGN